MRARPRDRERPDFQLCVELQQPAAAIYRLARLGLEGHPVPFVTVQLARLFKMAELAVARRARLAVGLAGRRHR